jgi:hypothetical protein
LIGDAVWIVLVDIGGIPQPILQISKLLIMNKIANRALIADDLVNIAVSISKLSCAAIGYALELMKLIIG